MPTSKQLLDDQLSIMEKSFLVAAFFRGGGPADEIWTSNSDQIVTLSLFYTGDISFEDCAERFSTRSYLSNLYNSEGDLTAEIRDRYHQLIDFIRTHGDLIRGGGNLALPAHPTYTACRLTETGLTMARSLVGSFPEKPKFQNWPDRRSLR